MLKNTGITIALAMLSMVGALGIDAYLPSFPAIIQDFQATPLAVQQTLSIYVGAMAITTLFAGTLSDSFGRRPTVIVSLLLFTAGSALAIFAKDIQVLLLARALQGVAAGFGSVLSRTIVQDRFQGAEAQRVMALIMMVFSIAPSFAPVIGGWLQATFGWHSVFIMLTSYGLVLWLLWQLGIPETLPKAQRMPLQLGRIVGNYGKVLCHRVFILRALSIAMIFIGVAIYISSAAPYIINILGLSETSFAWMFIPMTLGMLGGSSASRRLARKVAPSRLIFVGFALMLGATFTSVVYTSVATPQVPWAVIPLGIYTLGMTLAVPGMTVQVLSIFPQMRGLAASLQSFVQMGIFALVSAFVAPLLFHSAQWLAIAHFTGLVIAALLWALGPRHEAGAGAAPTGHAPSMPGPQGSPAPLGTAAAPAIAQPTPENGAPSSDVSKARS